MADFYRITNFIDEDDLMGKVRTALADVGYTVYGEFDNAKIVVDDIGGDNIYMYFDTNLDMRFQQRDINDNKASLANETDEIMRTGGNISEVHLIGWESPRALFAGFRRTDEVWVMWYVGDLDNIGGNPQGYIFSHSNQFYDGQTKDGRSVSEFPHLVEYGYDVQRPLFSYYYGNYREAWGTALSCDIGLNGGSNWLVSREGNSSGFLVPLVLGSFHYTWGSNLGWHKLQAVNPNYDFPSQLLPIDIYRIDNPYFFSLGNVAHVRATKRDGINALDRITIGNEEYLMLPWSRVGVRTGGIGSKNYHFAFKLTATQITPVSI